MRQVDPTVKYILEWFDEHWFGLLIFIAIFLGLVGIGPFT
jgi:hypothetical protein